MKALKGTGIALITPFKSDTSIDFSALGKLVEHVIKGGANFIVGLGTTGEPATMTSNEKQAIISYLAEVIDKRVPLIIGLGSNSTQEVINNIREYDLAGVDGILSVAPYYNKPTQKGIYMHFKTIANSTDLPIILYNVPGRTNSNILPETCIQLANDCENIIAIKEASGDIKQIMKIIKDKPSDFQLFAGDDALTIPTISVGGAGVISVAANAYPNEVCEMTNYALKNNYKAARDIQYKIMEMVELMFVEGNPVGIKAVLSQLGFCNNILRLPLVPASRQTLSNLQKEKENI